MLPSGVNPGFPVGGGADPLGGATYDFVKFSQKLHEIEKILGRGGRRARGAPLGSATGHGVYWLDNIERSAFLCILVNVDELF